LTLAWVRTLIKEMYLPKRASKGFSLIELLVVVAIISILATIGVSSFSSAQKKGRDTTRKSDLKGVASALENYYADNNGYPGGSSGLISCGGSSFNWGSDAFTCNGRTYLGQLPNDPTTVDYNYLPTSCTTISGEEYCQKYTLWADLELNSDQDINEDDDTVCTAADPDSSGGYNYCVHPNQ